MLHYPIAIELPNGDTAYGVVVPDLPGCFSAGDTLDEAIAHCEEAAAAWIDATLDAGGVIPKPSAIESVQRNPAYSDWIIALVNVDPALLDDSVERINISLPRRVLRRIDAKAKEIGETRSGYIARLGIG
jgi:predicted RNase H-like HicB family nuclease